MRITLLFSILLSTLYVHAQTNTLSGRVIDKSTGEPLGFASIGIRGKSIGTVSNLQGEFDFHFPLGFRNEILVVSMLGYISYEAPLWSLENTPDVIISMEKSNTILPEIIVQDSLSGGDILRIALNRINDNHPQEPYLLDGFYRDVKKVGGTYISLLEAAVQIYDDDFREPRNKNKLRERVRLVALRQSLGYENRYTSFFDQDNLLEDLLLNNNIRYRQIDADETLFDGMVREQNSYYNEHDIFVISYSGDYTLRLFIDKHNYSIIRLEYKKNMPGGVVDKKGGLVGYFMGMDKVIEFRKFNEKMYLSLITLTSRIDWHDVKTNELKFESELFQQLLINKINDKPYYRIGATENMKKYGLQYQHYTYDKEFWDSYNVIKRTPLDSQIVADLEKQGPLEEQFEDN